MSLLIFLLLFVTIAVRCDEPSFLLEPGLPMFPHARAYFPEIKSDLVDDFEEPGSSIYRMDSNWGQLAPGMVAAATGLVLLTLLVYKARFGVKHHVDAWNQLKNNVVASDEAGQRADSQIVNGLTNDLDEKITEHKSDQIKDAKTRVQGAHTVGTKVTRQVPVASRRARSAERAKIKRGEKQESSFGNEGGGRVGAKKKHKKSDGSKKGMKVDIILSTKKPKMGKDSTLDSAKSVDRGENFGGAADADEMTVVDNQPIPETKSSHASPASANGKGDDDHDTKFMGALGQIEGSEDTEFFDCDSEFNSEITFLTAHESFDNQLSHGPGFSKEELISPRQKESISDETEHYLNFTQQLPLNGINKVRSWLKSTFEAMSHANWAYYDPEIGSGNSDSLLQNETGIKKAFSLQKQLLNPAYYMLSDEHPSVTSDEVGATAGSTCFERAWRRISTSFEHNKKMHDSSQMSSTAWHDFICRNQLNYAGSMCQALSNEQPILVQKWNDHLIKMRTQALNGRLVVLANASKDSDERMDLQKRVLLSRCLHVLQSSHFSQELMATITDLHDQIEQLCPVEECGQNDDKLISMCHDYYIKHTCEINSRKELGMNARFGCSYFNDVECTLETLGGEFVGNFLEAIHTQITTKQETSNAETSQEELEQEVGTADQITEQYMGHLDVDARLIVSLARVASIEDELQHEPENEGLKIKQQQEIQNFIRSAAMRALVWKEILKLEGWKFQETEIESSLKNRLQTLASQGAEYQKLGTLINIFQLSVQLYISINHFLTRTDGNQSYKDDVLLAVTAIAHVALDTLQYIYRYCHIFKPFIENDKVQPLLDNYEKYKTLLSLMLRRVNYTELEKAMDGLVFTTYQI